MLKIKKTGKRVPVYDLHVPVTHNFVANGVVVHNCTEIIEPTYAGAVSRVKIEDFTADRNRNSRVIGNDPVTNELIVMDRGEVAVCNLGSINLARYVRDGKVDWAKLRKNVPIAVKFLDRVIDRNYYPVVESSNSNGHWRPVGLGIMGWQDMLFQMRIPFESAEAVALAAQLHEEIYYLALKTSCELSKLHGSHRDFKLTHAAKGLLQFDLSGAKLDTDRWRDLKNEIQQHGLRNSLLIAIAPTATIGLICGSNECIEPIVSNVFKRETLSGEFIQTNRYLVEDLKTLKLWNSEMLAKIKIADGSIQNIAEIPQSFKDLYKTVWEIKQKALIDQAVARGRFIDQSQSLNLFMANPDMERMASMYNYAWQQGVKTTYYLRSKPASQIQKVMDLGSQTPVPVKVEDEICESCT